jgi:mannose-6-phosphate isomerase-like protein (cupin superfamily)
VRLVSEGEFVWHSHAHEDELFFVLRGRLMIHFRDRVVEIGEGEFCIVPRGVERKPVAEEEVACSCSNLDPEHRRRAQRPRGRGARADLA